MLHAIRYLCMVIIGSVLAFGHITLLDWKFWVIVAAIIVYGEVRVTLALKDRR